jgi:two-component system sensor histidine kinase BarA
MSPLNLHHTHLPAIQAAVRSSRWMAALFAGGAAAIVLTLYWLGLNGWAVGAAMLALAAMVPQAWRMQREAAAQAARAAAESKARFLSVISHELRTPLNGILGFSELLAQDAAPQTHEAEYVQAIRESGHYLLGQINEVLELNSLEAGRVALQPGTLDPVALMVRLEARHRRDAARRHTELHNRPDLSLPPVLACDPQKLERVLDLLLRYAIAAGARTAISIEAWQTPAMVHFAVRSGGFELSDGEQENLFDKFAHFDESSTRHTTGFGLGLTIAWRLAQLMGAKLHVSSGAAGTSLELALPRQA